MIPAFPNAMPVEGFIGGVLIGLAAAIMLLGLGRIADLAIAPVAVLLFVTAMFAGMVTHRLIDRRSKTKN